MIVIYSAAQRVNKFHYIFAHCRGFRGHHSFRNVFRICVDAIMCKLVNIGIYWPSHADAMHTERIYTIESHRNQRESRNFHFGCISFPFELVACSLWGWTSIKNIFDPFIYVRTQATICIHILTNIEIKVLFEHLPLCFSITKKTANTQHRV